MLKRIWFPICILTIISLLMIYLSFDKNEIFGSTVDWVTQHSVFPEYFRNLFYETGQLIPEFALHLGGGQNIFHFSYYGFLSPVIMLSYLLPFVPIPTYITITSITSIIFAIILFYLWLIHKGVKERIAFVSSLFFLFSGPLLYHSHKQIMFVNYMPFLIISLWGVDRFFNRQKPILMVIGIFLMIMTSYYYSVGGILTVTLYGLYVYIETNDRFAFKSFLKQGSIFAISIICAIFMSGLLLLPSMAVIMSGRGESKMHVSIFQLLLPDFNLSDILYHCYSIGVTSIGIIAVIGGLISKRKEQRLLSLSLLIVLFIPFFRFVLNGGLYIRGKALIPFLPLAILSVANFITEIKNRKIEKIKFFIIMILWGIFLTFSFASNWKFLFALDFFCVLGCYYTACKKNQYDLFYIPSLFITCFICIAMNRSDTFEYKSVLDEVNSIEKQAVINEIINSDSSIYRFQDLTSPLKTMNKVYNTKFFKTSLYASTYNFDYLDLYANDFNNANPTSNKIAIVDSNNILFSTFMGVKYIVTKEEIPIGYQIVAQQGDYKVVKNNNVFPIGFASANIMSRKEYDNLKIPYKSIALLQNIIIEKECTKKGMDEIVEENFEFPLQEKEIGRYVIKSETNIQKNILLNKCLDQDIFILSFHIKNNLQDDVMIKANQTHNLLNTNDEFYANDNFDFSYVISSNDTLSYIPFEFSSGAYEIEQLITYRIPYEMITKAVNKVTPFIPRKNFGKANFFAGDINVQKDGYFSLQIPYDKGFRAYVDGKEVVIEKVNTAFMGFPITAGYHHITFVYHSPLLKEGKLLSCIGFGMFLILWFCSNRIYFGNKEKSNILF